MKMNEFSNGKVHTELPLPISFFLGAKLQYKLINGLLMSIHLYPPGHLFITATLSLPFFPPSLLLSFVPSFLPSFPPSLLSSFLLPSFLPSFLPPTPTPTPPSPIPFDLPETRVGTLPVEVR